MRKILTIASISLLAISLMAGCTSSPSNTSSTNTSNSSVTASSGNATTAITNVNASITAGSVDEIYTESFKRMEETAAKYIMQFDIIPLQEELDACYQQAIEELELIYNSGYDAIEASDVEQEIKEEYLDKISESWGDVVNNLKSSYEKDKEKLSK